MARGRDVQQKRHRSRPLLAEIGGDVEIKDMASLNYRGNVTNGNREYCRKLG